MTSNEIVTEFKKTERRVANNEDEAVALVLEQAVLMVELRKAARKQWEKICKSRLGMDPRVARRYLVIGANLAEIDRTPGSGLIARLPRDIQKLEALAKLPLDQLDYLARSCNLRRYERAEVIKKVQALLPKQTSKKTVEAAPSTQLLDRWDTFTEKFHEQVQSLDDGGRREIAEQLDTLLSEFRESITDALTAPADDAADSDEALDYADDEDADIGKEDSAASLASND